MANPILVTGAAGRDGGVGRAVIERLLRQGKAVRAMVRHEDERAQALRDVGAEGMRRYSPRRERRTGRSLQGLRQTEGGHDEQR